MAISKHPLDPNMAFKNHKNNYKTTILLMKQRYTIDLEYVTCNLELIGMSSGR